jgi:hypothetical protein
MYLLIFSLFLYLIYKNHNIIYRYLKMKYNMKEQIKKEELDYYKNLLE